MNDYGMPFPELLERLDKFMASPEYARLIDDVCEQIITRANSKPIYVEFSGHDNFMPDEPNSSYQNIEQCSLSKDIDYLIAC